MKWFVGWRIFYGFFIQMSSHKFLGSQNSLAMSALEKELKELEVNVLSIFSVSLRKHKIDLLNINLNCPVQYTSFAMP